MIKFRLKVLLAMNDMTQMQLAEKLNITDRAVSKWENGKTAQYFILPYLL